MFEPCVEIEIKTNDKLWHNRQFKLSSLLPFNQEKELSFESGTG
jgi:hypothetical protein